MRRAKKADKVWQYLLKNKLATTKEVAKACGVTYSYAHKLMSKVSTPKEVFEKEANKLDRCDLLREAVSLTNGDRLKDYGSPVDNHQHIARIFTAITGKHVTGRDIAIMHQATKLARRQTTPLEKDHYIDNMAYVGIEYECAVEEE
jgi:hypothetical protein